MAKTIYAKDPEKFISALAEALKKIPEFQIPEWALFVKSGVSRERPPVGSNFWYIRAASILRQLYIKGVLGVGRIRTRYGSRKDMGGRPDKFAAPLAAFLGSLLKNDTITNMVTKKRNLGRSPWYDPTRPYFFANILI